MKDTKKIFCHFSFYDQAKMQETLEEMARQGWMIQKPGNFTWTFQRITPKNLRFSVTYFPNASDFDPGPTDGELTKMDFCAQDGWKLAARWGVMQIFYNEDPDAIPIETDPVAQVENIRKTMKKSVGLTHLFTVALTVYYLVFQYFQLRRDPAGYLSDPLQLYQIPLWICLLLSSLYELCFYLHWTRKAKRMAEEDGVFLPIKAKVKASYFLVAFSFLLQLLAFGSSKKLLLFALIWYGVMCLITLSANAIKGKLKQRGASRRVNLALSIGSILIFYFCFLGAMVSVMIHGDFSFRSKSEPVGTYEYHGRVQEIYNDPLPLVIEDLTTMAGSWSKEADHQETGLVAYTEYDQRSLLTEPPEVKDLYYTITEIKIPFLYDWVKQTVLNSRQDEVHGDFVLTDHYEPVDASLWMAEEAYQLHFSDSILNTYLVCWENRIVEIKFYWEPTAEQIAKAAEILRQS